MRRLQLAALAGVITTVSVLHAQTPMTGTGVITGVVRDQRGQVVEGARVSAASRAKRWNGPYRAVAIGVSDDTDDRGMFRLHSLPPGELIVGVLPGQSQGRASVTYYPSAIELPDAAVVSLDNGTEVDISIVLQSIPQVPVTGVVRDANNTPAANMDVVLVPQGADQHLWGGTAVASTRSVADGSFTMNARPGDYTIVARRLNGPRTEGYVQRELTISGQPVTGLELMMGPGATVSGRLVWEGDGPQPWPQQGPFARLRAATVNQDFPVYDVRDFQVAGDGTFMFEGLQGPIRFQEMGMPLRLVRVEAPPDATTSRGIELTPGTTVSDVRIVVSNRSGTLVSVVRDGDQTVPKTTVLILPESPTAHTPNAMGWVAVTAPGATVFDLLEGTYLVVATDIGAGVLQQDTRLMEQARAAATRVAVKGRAPNTVSVPLTRLHAVAQRFCACKVEQTVP